ncbi:conserved hypothetical protein [Paraburkholderia tropica]|uniref:hypothetical protein n=1 Tax=Paraburkholderia tropica TaxID=92647 RepID=UPI001CAFC3BB|nr:hypothetical protein [Paraburkholderia tropica]CAG9195747.1 conserved hypothetical protein [Paraburkholderia tropica]
MTLDQLRAELEGHAPGEVSATTLAPAVARDPNTEKLYRLATQRARRTRMQLPHNQMPVLP